MDLNFTAVPSPPHGQITIEEVTHSSVSLSWRAPKSLGGLELTGYVIERRDRRHLSWLKVDRVKPSITSYCVQNLLEGNEYFFRIYAENSEGLSEPLETNEAIKVCRETGLDI